MGGSHYIKPVSTDVAALMAGKGSQYQTRSNNNSQYLATGNAYLDKPASFAGGSTLAVPV